MVDEGSLSAPRILLLADYGETGGTRTYFKQLLTLYAEKHARVTVVRTYEEEDEEIDLLCQQHGFKCFGLKSVVGDNNILEGKPIVRFFLERKLLKNFIKNSASDIVVASVGSPELFLAALSWARKSIYILHTYPQISNNILKRILRKLFYSVLVSSTARLITVSKYSRKRILQAWGLWGRTNDVQVIYSSVGESIITRPLPGNGIISVLTVGHTEWYKNPDIWIEVAIQLRRRSPDLDIRFKWVGDGSRLNECREKIKSLGAETYISFIGSDNNVAEHYDQCDIYMQPSHIESLGLSVLDAMRYGKPCVVANTGGLPEAICDGKSGWVVEVDNVKEMAYRIEMLARDKKLREAMGQNAIKTYKELFSHSRWTKEMWSHHEHMLKAYACALDH
jgi:glycosyltransferase involved in cell wall biosynthesis